MFFLLGNCLLDKKGKGSIRGSQFSSRLGHSTSSLLMYSNRSEIVCGCLKFDTLNKRQVLLSTRAINLVAESGSC